MSGLIKEGVCNKQKPTQHFFKIILHIFMNQEKINQQELTEHIARMYDIQISQADDIIRTFLELIILHTTEGKKVHLVSLGTFFTKLRPGRKGRNPRTMEEIDVPSVVTPKFVPSSLYKRTVRHEEDKE